MFTTFPSFLAVGDPPTGKPPTVTVLESITFSAIFFIQQIINYLLGGGVGLP